MKGHYIGGEWQSAGNGRENINPSDLTDCIDHYADGESSHIEAAVDAAKAALPTMAATTPQQRADWLDRIGSEILARAGELGHLLAREEGKTLPEGQGEVRRAGQIFKYFAGEALRQEGQLLDSVRPNVNVEVTREPLGVVGLITPWNFPIAIPAWKIAPALAFGNTVVHKPAELTPGCAWALAEIIAKVGLPEGAFNLVMGAGASVGEALVNHPHIAGISFTGSVATGAKVSAATGARRARVQLEMGGKNPLVVLDDADLDGAVAIALNGAFFSTGQRCTASSRLIVTEGIHDAFVAALIKALSHLRVGDALDPQTQMGPVVDAGQMEKNLRYIELGSQEGAKLAFGGRRLTREKNGFYLEPALFTETHGEMAINRDEIFGPIASVIRVKDYAEALATANDTPFGLSAGICTNSLSAANDFKRHAQAGMIMVNLPTAGVDYHVPFGGRKASSYGTREQGRFAAEFYTTVKTTYVARG